MKGGAQCLNGTLCLGQMCNMEDLIHAFIIPGSRAELNLGIFPSSLQSLRTQWGLRKRRKAKPAFLISTLQNGVGNDFPMYIKSLKVAGYALSCLFQAILPIREVRMLTC